MMSSTANKESREARDKKRIRKAVKSEPRTDSPESKKSKGSASEDSKSMVSARYRFEVSMVRVGYRLAVSWPFSE